MVKVTVCIGSSCHLKGSRQVVEELQYLINKNGLDESVELSGTFCMGKCGSDGVSVTVDGEYYAVKPEAVLDLFTDVIAKRQMMFRRRSCGGV